MPRKYKLEIEDWSIEYVCFASRGHHDFDEFIAELRRVQAPELKQPKHFYIKAVPCSTGEYSCLYITVPKKIRGSFPATIATEF